MAKKGHHKAKGKKHHAAKHDGRVPLEVLEKRLKRLNTIVKSRGGKHLA